MREADREGSQEEHVSPNALRQLLEVLNRITKANYSPGDPLDCSICHQPITLETKGICVDEHGKVAHTDCYIRQVIGSTKKLSQPDNQA
jgi:hypothetical protein